MPETQQEIRESTTAEQSVLAFDSNYLDAPTPAPEADVKSSNELTPADHARNFASEIIRMWPDGQTFDAQRVIKDHPELEDYKSVMIDLAFEEYCSRTESGEVLVPEEYVQGFDNIQQSLLHLLAVEQFLQDNFDPLANPDAIDWPDIEQEFLGFDLVGRLGKGTFSRVFLGRERNLADRLVVVKICLLGAEEAHILGSLRHPKIGEVYSVSFDKTTGLHAICMPYISRATLFDVLDEAWDRGRKPETGQVVLDAVAKMNHGAELPQSDLEPQRDFTSGTYIDSIANIAQQITSALIHTHTRGIFHCDIKPSNVLVSPDGTARLFDYNLSATIGEKRNNLGGTLPYMAPEQLQVIASETADNQADYPVSAETDLFALGVTLYQLLTGELPFGDIPSNLPKEELAKLIIDKQMNGAVPIQSLSPQINNGLAAAIHSCLEIQPEKRLKTAAQLLERLQPQTKPIAKLRRFTRTHKVLAALAVVVLMLGIGFVGRTGINWHRRVELALENARDAFEAGDLQAALNFYQTAKNYDSSSPAALDGIAAVTAEMGQVALAEGDFEAAAKHFENALKIDDKNHEWRIRLGYALLEQTKLHEALHHFERITRENPRFGQAYAAAGYVYYLTRLPGEALDRTRKAVLANFETAEVLCNRGWLTYKTGTNKGYYRDRPKDDDLAIATRDMQSAVKTRPDLLIAWCNLLYFEVRRSYEGRNNPDEPPVNLELFNDPLQRFSGSPDIHLNAAKAYIIDAEASSGSDYTQAIEFAQRTLKLGCSKKRLEEICTYAEVGFRKNPEFKQLISGPVGDGNGVQPLPRVVNPLKYLRKTPSKQQQFAAR